MFSLKGKKRSTALFGKQEQSPRQSSIAAVDGRKLIPVRENVEKVHSRDSCYNRGILMSFPSQFVNKIQKIVHHQGASNIIGFMFDVCRLLQPVSSRNYALVQLPVTVLSTLNNTPKSEIFKLHSIMFSINEGLSVYRSCVLRWWGSEKQIMILFSQLS